MKNKLLIIKNDGLGDAVIAMPIIKALISRYEGRADIICKHVSAGFFRKQFPDCNVIVFDSDIYFKFPNLDNISVFAKIKELVKFFKYRASKADKVLMANLSNHHYDEAFVVRRFIRQSTLFVMNSIKADLKVHSTFYPTNFRELDCDDGWIQVGSPQKFPHEQSFFRDAFKKFTENGETFAVKKIDMPDLERVKGLGLAIVLGNPGRGLKRDIFCKLLVFIRTNYPNLVVNIYGGQDTQKFLRRGRIEEDIRINIWAGRLSFEDSVSHMIKNNGRALGNDTGFMHLAAFHGLSLLVFTSGETPKRFFPWSSKQNQVVIRQAISCADCSYCSMPKRYCMDFLSTDVNRYVKLYLDGDLRGGEIEIGDKQNYLSAWRWK